MDNTTIQKFLDEHDYDIRKTHNGRWIDQKCTMDVVCLVSDCIVEYTSNREDKRFTVNDIWYSDYTVENVQQIFSKPNPTQKASNEYDKYFGQPIKLLDAAGVIHGEKSGRGYTYSIVNQELLEYISFRERNSFNFLCLYIEKVLKDSGLYRIFEYFFRLQDKNSFRELKDAYTQFTINYTPINGATECGRIFTKVLNPLLYKYPIVNSSTIAQCSNIPSATINRYLNVLVDADILYTDDKSRNRTYFYYDLLNILRE